MKITVSDNFTDDCSDSFTPNSSSLSNQDTHSDQMSVTQANLCTQDSVDAQRDAQNETATEAEINFLEFFNFDEEVQNGLTQLGMCPQNSPINQITSNNEILNCNDHALKDSNTDIENSRTVNTKNQCHPCLETSLIEFPTSTAVYESQKQTETPSKNQTHHSCENSPKIKVTRIVVQAINVHTDQIPSTSHFSSIMTCLQRQKGVQDTFSDEQSQNIEENVTPSFICNICNRSYFSTTGIAYHKASVHDIGNFKCDICNKNFSTSLFLKQHKIHIHTKEFRCCVCNAQFEDMKSLTKHRRRNHREQVPSTSSSPSKISCFPTEEGVRNTLNVEQNQGTTENDKPTFACNSCNSTYLSTKRLKYHMAKEHGISGTNCNICDENFPFHYLLRQHIIRYHSNKFDCCMCRNLFRDMNSLTVHKNRNHADITCNPPCSLCMQNLNLIDHVYL